MNWWKTLNLTLTNCFLSSSARFLKKCQAQNMSKDAFLQPVSHYVSRHSSTLQNSMLPSGMLLLQLSLLWRTKKHSTKPTTFICLSTILLFLNSADTDCELDWPTDWLAVALPPFFVMCFSRGLDIFGEFGDLASFGVNAFTALKLRNGCECGISEKNAQNVNV